MSNHPNHDPVATACTTGPLVRRRPVSSGRRFLPAWIVTARTVIALIWLALVPARAGLAAASEVPYVPQFQGVEDKALERLLRSASDTFSLQDRPPASMGLLKRRVSEDVPGMIEALRSEGYYGGDVAFEVDEEARPVGVLFRVDAGPQYTIEGVDLDAGSGTSPFSGAGLPGPDEPLLAKGAPARADDIVKARDRLVALLKDRGHPFARGSGLRVRVDHARRTARVAMTVVPGPEARFGKTSLTGLETVEEPYARSRLTWQEGEPFNASLLERARDRLLRTGLFASIELRPGEALDEGGRIPITLTLRERKHRTVGVGLRYHTDEGPGVQGSWKHRNLFGRGERLSIEATVSPDLVGMESTFRKPEFLHPDQSLLLEADAGIESPDAFSSRRLYTAAGLERRISDSLLVGGGVGLTASRVDQRGEEEGYALLSLPLRLDWDRSNDLLNPTRGTRMALRLTPFTEILDEDLRFVRGYASLSHYLPLLQEPSLVLATRGALGAMTGASRDRIPADERFYAGGGGSVRGLPYQSAGPLEGTQPLGGRSLVEVSAELRWRLTQDIGVVGFVDGGRAYEDSVPGSLHDLQWGIGAGVRYYTFLGPLRLDVAVPMDRREGVDDAFQIYVSLGQAF